MPFDPMKSAAMRAAQLRQANPLFNADAPPLSPSEERALIESAAPDLPAADLMAGGGSPARPWSVSELNACLNQLLVSKLPTSFFIQGEISNFRTYDRGHAFFTLKDKSSELPCVVWKDALARLKFKPKDGLSVIVRGGVRLYEPQGKLQVYVETILPQGAGALELAFRQLCEKLKAEGLFEVSRKRPLPRLPRHIAIITSKTGDVLHDVLTTALRRYPGLQISLYAVRVQGNEAAGDMIRAIKLLNKYNAAQSAELSPLDLILLVRGGGSLEDLWPFNEESLARAIVNSKIPIATGIGHEPDTTIADLVGDRRGPTPTGITELTIPDTRALSAELASRAVLLTRDVRRTITLWQTRLDRTAVSLHAITAQALRDRRQRLDQDARKIAGIEPRHAIAQGWRRVEESDRRLVTSLRQRLQKSRESLTRASHRLDRTNPLTRLHRHRDRLDTLQNRLHKALLTRTATATQKLTALAQHLRVVSPQSILDRGFSITSNAAGEIIRSTSQVQKGDPLTTKVADGTIHSTVGKPKQSSLF